MLGPLLFAAMGTTPEVDISGGGSATTTSSYPAGALASVEFRRDGGLRLIGNFTDELEWHASPTPAIGDEHEIMAELTGGVIPVGPGLGVWHVLDETRSWSLSLSDAGSISSNLRISIRRIGLAPAPHGQFSIAATVIGGGPDELPEEAA